MSLNFSIRTMAAPPWQARCRHTGKVMAVKEALLPAQLQIWRFLIGGGGGGGAAWMVWDLGV